MPTLGHLKPASQGIQAFLPSELEYVPLAQRTYTDSPSVGQWAPLGQE